MKVLIVGGTGFLGYHATHELLHRGHAVTTLARRPITIADFFPAAVQVKLADVNTMPDDQFQQLASDHDAVIYAAGAHASNPFKGDAYAYFYKENVQSPARVFNLSRRAGVKRGVLLGSYFNYFDRTHPELKLAETHPYIRSRREQAKESLAAALPNLELMVLEIPWVFGAFPGRASQWQSLVRYVQSPLPLFFTEGGTNMIAASRVAQAIAGALEHGKSGESYLVGDENLTWAELLTRISAIIGNHKRVITIPTPIVQAFSGAFQVMRNLQGKTSGLVASKFISFQTSNSFFDASAARQALGYEQGGFEQALQETVHASQKNQ